MKLHPSFTSVLLSREPAALSVPLFFLRGPPRFSNVQDSSFSIFSPDPSPELYSVPSSGALGLLPSYNFPGSCQKTKVIPSLLQLLLFFWSLLLSVAHCPQFCFVFKVVLCSKMPLASSSNFLAYSLCPWSGLFHLGLDD